MADYYALTRDPLPTALHGADSGYSIRVLSDRERLAIEDYFFSRNVRITLNADTTAVIFPQSQAADATMEDVAVLIEFALAILTVSGFQPVTVVAVIGASNCSDALQRSYHEVTAPPAFAKKVVKGAASTWVRRFFAARRSTKDKMHITADRFGRYSRLSDTRDALVELCICLESLIESQTEISFRFSMCLAKIAGLPNAEEISGLLSDLYSLRSKVVHGTDSTKEHKKIAAEVAKLRLVARAILTTYVLYLTEHSKDEWKKHLSRSLFA